MVPAFMWFTFSLGRQENRYHTTRPLPPKLCRRGRACYRLAEPARMINLAGLRAVRRRLQDEIVDHPPHRRGMHIRIRDRSRNLVVPKILQPR